VSVRIEYLGASTFRQIRLSAQAIQANIDVALSTRAADSTVQSVYNALAQVEAQVATGDWRLKIRNDEKLANLDVALSTHALLARWGRSISPRWIIGSEVSAPAAGAALLSQTVSAGKSGYIYGFFITASEANQFYLQWSSGGTAYKRRIILPSAGTVHYADFVPLNEGLPADASSTVSIIVVNAGSSGSVYQAGILYGEV